MKAWLEGFLEINRESVSTEMVWDALKAGIRGETLSYSIRRSKIEEERVNELYAILANLEGELVKAIAQGSAVQSWTHKIAVAKAKIGEDSSNKAAEKYLAWREGCYELNEQVGHMLAVRTRQARVMNEILEIQDQHGNVISEATGIKEAFHKYYSALYQEENPPSRNLIREYLDNVQAERFETQDMDMMEMDITEEELYNALRSLPSGKAVGPDQIPLEFYKTFYHSLKQDIIGTFRQAQNGNAIPKTWAEAVIVVF